MSAYVVFTREQTTDVKLLEQYAQKASTASENHDLQALAFYGQFEVLEGNDIEGAVILRFPDMATARNWYNSPAYQEALQYRLKGATYRVFIIDGSFEPS
ncbi:MAG: DUF1330 domain-containing protein [Acinetobacter sp.]